MSAGLVISRAILSILYLILYLKGSQCRLELFNFSVAELNFFSSSEKFGASIVHGLDFQNGSIGKAKEERVASINTSSFESVMNKRLQHSIRDARFTDLIRFK